MKVFVIHYKKLIDRKKNIIEQFKKYNISNYEFIEIDRDELNEEDFNMFVKNFPTYHIAITLSHLYAYKQISEKYDDGLIFEDDIILSDDFINIYNKYINQLPIDYDMFFIGDGCNLHIENNKLLPDKNVYEKCLYPTGWGGDGGTRCIDSYLVNKKCAIEIVNYFNNLTEKITLPPDWFLNVVIRNKQFKIYWAEPTIVTQGSQCGIFERSIKNIN